MNIDIILVTYNSQKWIDKCLNSVANCLYDIKKLNIFIIDNKSSDLTVSMINELKKHYSKIFGGFHFVENKNNIGFGQANNHAFKYGNSEYVLFLNIDTEIASDSLSKAAKIIHESDRSVAAWELRQFPYEHPKNYDPVTQYTSWVSGAAFIIKRRVFEEVNGFDKSIFMYAEDVDLSWRVRAKGYNLRYMPDSIVYHYSYETINQVKPTQYINSIINNLNLRVRYGTIKDVINGLIKFSFLMTKKQPFRGARIQTLIKCFLNIKYIPRFLAWRFFNRQRRGFTPTFHGWDYEVTRTGAFYENSRPNLQPLVSILIRTHGRTQALREALVSVRNQTYKNIEAVVVEDGMNLSEGLIKEEFTDLNIIYLSTGEKVGRSKAANIALDTASGVYLNFLDDDDLLFSDHVEVLVNELNKNDKNVAYSVAFEVPTKIISSFSDKKNMNYNVVYQQPFNRMKLFYQNYIPIQSAMFKREIVREKVYMDEYLDALEDWDFWVRIAAEYEFHFVNKTTSLYRVPFDKTDSANRQKFLDESLHILRDKQKSYYSKVNVFEVSQNVAELVSQDKKDLLKQKYKLLFKIYRMARKILVK
ncbi:glycosyltransferase family 2 protein [Paenibacillus chitinolyticus]|uniref:glycosyltransferase family 2 protein n=1 Tax=Paenibacillus chitinolyticus TaxID=79263 RepID=UPI002DBBCB9E|nr:glycosyltransferase family 2 protein [Paenibacillus chitinolyticus]MEC0245085.1 glycosyltransferase family 2 protein [Paenibacillus chitinolyticus]